MRNLSHSPKMSELALENVVDEKQQNQENTSSINNITDTTIIDLNVSDDLEDGEIDDDDENEETADADVVITSVTTVPAPTNTPSENSKLNGQTQSKKESNVGSIVTIDLLDDTDHVATLKASKLKSQPVEDDHASSIENALANVLLKKGIEPTMPKILEQRGTDDNQSSGQSRSSRRRKRKKQREEKEKKKKSRQDSPDRLTGPPPLTDEEDMDDYEMMNVRGGSPPPISHTSMPPAISMSQYPPYDSEDDSESSYDSADSAAGGDRNRRRRKRSRERKRKRNRERNRDEDEKKEKRNRRNSEDEKHRSEPQKLELCKFYLMECCAKREKCSYMHKEFPCKYYYLGMDCVSEEPCKFLHGEPLTVELRNILLKHLETAPKEILGNFKRISKENAMTMIIKRHEELCQKYNVQNVWPPNSIHPMNMGNRRSDRGHNNNTNTNQQSLLMQQKSQSQNNKISNIPSLLDIVVNPPVSLQNKSSADKPRKSRWADSGNINTSSSTSSSTVSSNKQYTETDLPACFDLKNLSNIISAEHMTKMNAMGITNLKQVEQLTFGQLNEIGLTIAEVSEIQLNAMNMAKLGIGTGGTATTAKTSNSSAATPLLPTPKMNKSETEMTISSSRDVDMRFLPSVVGTISAASILNPTDQTNTASPTIKETSTIGSLGMDKDVTMSSNSNSSSGVITVDYSQYLKDSNLSFDKGDLYDDEKDEEQLVIDDGNIDQEDNSTAIIQDVIAKETENKKEVKDDSMENSISLPRLPPMGNLHKALQNPFFLKSDPLKKESEDELESTKKESKSLFNPFRVGGGKNSDDEHSSSNDEYERNYYKSRSYRRSHSRSRSRSRSHTPSRSSTPEASQSPTNQGSSAEPRYERNTIYDFSVARQKEEDEAAENRQGTRTDKDMRFLPGTDMDLRLPFQPVLNYTPATEIDGSINSHLPISYKVYVVDVPAPNYRDLRKSFQSSDQTADPRLRRILGLPELSPSSTSAALSRSVRKLSNNIASPEAEELSSPKYYTPPSSKEELANNKQQQHIDPRNRGDPRSRADPRNDPRSKNSESNNNSQNSTDPRQNESNSSSNAGMKQNVEIRNLLQKSEWYKNLNSKFKIMVNQQLALVSTELKKFHQDSSPNKIFDISFIVNNSTLQQILTQLGIYIDENGEVAHVDGDDNSSNNGRNSGANGPGITLPNLSQPPPNQNLDFLRAPPPNIGGPGGSGLMFRPGMDLPPQIALNIPPPRPSLLGLPPGTNPFNPFAGGMPNMGVGPNFMGGPGIMGPGPAFGNFGPNMPPGMMGNMQQRNFGNQQRNQRNQQNRRKNFGNNK